VQEEEEKRSNFILPNKSTQIMSIVSKRNETNFKTLSQESRKTTKHSSSHFHQRMKTLRNFERDQYSKITDSFGTSARNSRCQWWSMIN